MLNWPTRSYGVFVAFHTDSPALGGGNMLHARLGGGGGDMLHTKTEYLTRAYRKASYCMLDKLLTRSGRGHFVA